MRVLKSWKVLFGMVALIACLASCASSPSVRSQPPALQIDVLALERDRARIILLLHNRNDHPLEISAINLRMRFDELTLFEQVWEVDLVMDARGRERVTLDASVDAVARNRLLALERGTQNNLAYRLEGAVELADQRDATVESDGFLHPVPGQPGQFR